MAITIRKNKRGLEKYKQLCSFMASKNFLWNISRQFIHENCKPGNIAIDCACQAALTREIFPNEVKYVGADIEIERLKIAIAKSIGARKNDRFLLGDLVKKGWPQNYFDLTVSLNTLSHLSLIDSNIAIENLIEMTKKGGHLVVNMNIDQSIYEKCKRLDPAFESIEVVYTESLRSLEYEKAGKINGDNIEYMTKALEEETPNDAVFHRQILFLCKNKIEEGKSFSKLKDTGSIKKVIKINNVVNIERSIYENDISLLEDLTNQNIKHVILSDRLWNYANGLLIRDRCEKLGIACSCISDKIKPITSDLRYVAAYGFEIGWVGDQKIARQYLNEVRRENGLIIGIVKNRENHELRSSDIQRFG